MNHLLALYKENEDKNEHSKNVVLTALFNGNISQLREAVEILASHKMTGHLTQDLAEQRTKLINSMPKIR